METMPLEADTRVLIDRSLENLGWKLTGADKNVYFETPRTEKEKQALEHKRPDYILYHSETKQPLIVIEAKRKGGRLDTAMEQGIYYAERLKAPIVFATDGIFCRSYHTASHKAPLLNGSEIDEFIREALAIKYLTDTEVNTISKRVQYDRKELIKIFDDANNMLRGSGLRAGIERFGEFANILFLKLLTEKGDVNSACAWDTIKQIPFSSRIQYINNTVLNTLNTHYNTEIFTPLTINDNLILQEIMEKLDPLKLTDIDSDVKGDAFEYFLKASTSTKNDLGEYFTPRHIVKTMVRLANPQIGEKVYDPFCGTGGFLIESFRHIWNNMSRNEFTEKTLRENTIFGNELTSTARITKMNMILAGDGHSGIHQRDSLDLEKNKIVGKYDVVLANMPYSQKLTKQYEGYDLPSKNGDSMCVQHCMKAINATSENGRMALVVPEGFLFRKDLAKIREYLLQNSELQSIISLPQGVFLPYTGVKTNIIYATKVNQKISNKDKKKDYWYFDVKSDGYSLDNHRRKLEVSSDLQKYEEYRNFDSQQRDEMLKVGFNIIPFEKVKNNDFNLVGKRYKENSVYQGNYPLLSLNELCTLETGSREKGGSRSIGIPSIGGEQINNDGNIITEKMRYISENYFSSLNKGKLKTLDVLLVKDGATTGKVGIYKGEYKQAAVNEHVFILRANSKILPLYLYYLLRSNYFQNELKIYIRGMIGGIGREILDIKIPLPPLEVQQKIVAQIETEQEIINSYKRLIEISTKKIQDRINQIFKE